MKVILLIVGSVLAANAASTPPREPRLIWEDNFDTLDESRWNHLVTGWDGGNTEFQYYRNNRKNSYAEGGMLKIRATMAIEDHPESDLYNGYQNEPGCTLEPCTILSNPGGQCIKTVYSARLHSQGTFSTAYGRIEIRAKMPRGDWLWPAMWMMPEKNTYGGWPASGEVDIVETRGNRNIRTPQGVSVGINNVGNTMHWGPRWPYNGYSQTHWETILPSGDYSDDFHIYELEWTPDHIRYKIDGAETGYVSPGAAGFWNFGGFNVDPGTQNPWAGAGMMAPFDKPFYLIFNIAVGGTFFDESFISEPAKPWNLWGGRFLCEFHEARGSFLPTWDRPTMDIDYVRVYEI